MQARAGTADEERAERGVEHVVPGHGAPQPRAIEALSAAAATIGPVRASASPPGPVSAPEANSPLLPHRAYAHAPPPAGGGGYAAGGGGS